jgi:hypothetical protein
VGWEGDELPACWQMVAIDTITVDSPDGYSAPLLPGASYLGLVPKTATYDQLVTAMVQNTSVNMRQDAFAGWLAERIIGAVAFGAGQNRAVGRAVSAANLSRMQARLNEAYNAARNAVTDLVTVSSLLGAQGSDTSPTAVVITSLSGGTGSGMFLDVVESLKAVDHELGRRAQLILYGPDVFEPLLRSAAGAGIPANTLASLAEITSGIWREGVSAGTQSLYEGGGLGSALNAGMPGVGSRYNYVIGATNSAGDFVGTMDAAYRATGESLTALITDERVADGFVNFFRINTFDNSSQKVDKSGLKTQDILMGLPMASFGSSRVALGMEAFGEYAEEVVARGVVESLLFPHFHRDPSGRQEPPAVLVGRRMEDSWKEFLESSGLNERNPANDVCDAINPPDVRSRCEALAAGVMGKATAGIGAKGAGPDEIAAKALARYNAEQPEFLERDRVELHSAARRWAQGIEARLLRLVAERSARLGLIVTADLVAKLRAECDFGAFQMRGEAQGFRNQLDQLAGELRADLSRGGLSTLQPGHQNIKSAQSHLAEFSGASAAAQRYELAASLIEDVSQNLLGPLEQCLRDCRAALLIATENDKTSDGRPNPWHAYPARGAQPSDRFQSGPTDFLLIDPNDYPTRLEQRARESVGDAASDQWFERLCDRAAIGLPVDERGDTFGPGGSFRSVTLFDRVPGWMPQDAATRWGEGLSAQRGRYLMPFEPEHYAKRAKAAIEDKETALGKFVGESLQHYLESGNLSEQAQRQQLFVDKLKQAFSKSAPLAKINLTLASLLHPDIDPRATHKTVSTIPVTAGTALYAAIENALGVHWDASRSPGWFGVTTSSQVDVFQASESAMHSMAFSSLMDPIHVRWQEVKSDADMRHAFWGLRRSRPLQEAIPMAEDKQRAFIRGWIVAGWLGLRKNEDLRNGLGLKVAVWDASTGDSLRWADFPYPLLGASVDGPQMLPAVLKSVGLAMVEANATTSLKPLRPYGVLVELGDNCENVVRDWLVSGQTVPGGPTPPANLAGSSDQQPEQRRQAILAGLEGAMLGYRQRWNSVETSRIPFVRDASWELREITSTEYERVYTLVNDLELNAVQY